MSDETLWTLDTLYCILLILLVAHLFSLRKKKHSYEALQLNYTVISANFAVMRVIYITLEGVGVDWRHRWIQVVLIWLPIALQFSSFTSLLLVYITHAVEDSVFQKAPTIWKHIGRTSNIFFYISGIFFIAYGEATQDLNFSEMFITISTCLMYLVLATAFVGLAVFIYRKPKPYLNTMIYQTTERSWMVLSIVLMISFIHRSIYSFYYIFISPNAKSPYDRALESDFNVEYLAWGVLWEILPTLATVAFLKVPQGRDAMRERLVEQDQNLLWSPRSPMYGESSPFVGGEHGKFYSSYSDRIVGPPYSSQRQITFNRPIPRSPESNASSDLFLSHS
eukprot:TRINITY_DN10363_c0_g1_i1.p1 TRINITY_DN10363_c0_g1~~TRINITY_DN10363_c0_g1_i1.p1  ORF type:complete len:336 (-),score=62.16 TRINITY_DN10363_c0_g1_i1:279-1286(-)